MAVSKYGAKRCSVGAEKYRSQRERDRHQDLLLMERGGAVRNLRREVVYVLAPAVKVQGRNRPPLRYIADFVYERTKEGGWITVVEDAKGVRTAVYSVKRHLMMAVHGIEILET